MRLAIVLVHYHAAELAVRAVDALRGDLAGSGVEVEWAVVDNGSDEGERSVLAALPGTRLDPGENLGYAGGVNLGVKATTAESILVMNPDVMVFPGCVGALLAALADGAAVAGPRFFWDAERRLMLPPTELRSRREEVSAALAERGGAWARRARRRWRRHAHRHWRAATPLPSYALSGALLALRRGAWDAAGPFDSGFPLYFEETDWLKRAERLGLPARYVPAAEAVHLYDQSAGREPRAAAWFATSAERFRRRHYGAWFTPLFTRLQGRRRSPVAAPGGAGPRGRRPPRLIGGALDLTGFGRSGPLWVEVSPRAAGFPAAAERLADPLAAPWTLPAEVLGRLPAGTELTLQVVDDGGGELARYRFAPTPPMPPMPPGS